MATDVMNAGAQPRGKPPISLSRLSTGSDVEIAYCLRDALVREHGRVVFDEGAFWQFTGTHWRPIPATDLRCQVHGFDGARISKAKQAVRLGKGRIDSILNELGAIVAEPGFFSTQAIGINCASGFIAFGPTGTPELKSHSPDYRCRHTLSAKWAPELGGPLHSDSMLAQLIEGVFKNDADAAEKAILLAEVAGASALGYGTKLLQPKAIILKGETAENGKSQVLEVLRGLLPPDAVTTVSAASMCDEHHRIGLSGKLLNACDELSSSNAIESDVFKALITGDPVEGRDLYKSRIEFRPVAQHVFATNALPPFHGGMDRGVQRRLLLITFNRVIPMRERIEAIGKRIPAVEPDILLAWAVDGACRLIARRNFTVPPSSEIALSDWIYGADPVVAWLHEAIDVSPIYDSYPSVTTREAYENFAKRATREGHDRRRLPSINTFVQRVKAHAAGIEYRRTNHGRYFLGMRLRQRETDEIDK